MCQIFGSRKAATMAAAISVLVAAAPSASSQTLTAASRDQHAERLSFPLVISKFPVAAGDTFADRVLGQMDFAHATQNFATASTLDLQGSLAGVAIDQSSVPSRVYVADTANNRVLGWSSAAALVNGKPASLVIGQPDFFSTTCNNGGVSAASLCRPSSVVVDSSGNLYVADGDNSRVLAYNTPFANTGEPGSGDKMADRVFGQGENFTAAQCNQGAGTVANAGTLCRPAGLVVDATGVLYIADQGNNRVLEYLFPQVDSIAHDVFGQNGQFSTGVCNKNGLSADSLCTPSSLATDSFNNLYIADSRNSRVLEYDNPRIYNTTADKVIGQGNSFLTGKCNGGAPTPGAATLCGPTGVVLGSGGQLYVADQGNARILEYTVPATGAAAAKVFGQSAMSGGSCNSSGAVNAAGLCGPSGVALDAAGNLYVADAENNRVLKYNAALAGDTIADVELGQLDFAHNDHNAVDASGYGGSAADVILAGTLNIGALGAVAVDNSVSPPRLYVADNHNNRVLGYNNAAAFLNGAPADIVIGQPNFTTGSSQACRPFGLATAFNLCSPTGVAVDAQGNLYVADELDNRVLKFQAPVTTGKAASLVIGQPDFASTTCNTGLAAPTANTLCGPWNLATDPAGNLYVADAGNSRVLEYPKPQSPNPSAANVFGQPGFTSSGCNQKGNPSIATLCQPTGVAVDANGRLFVADYNNNRVLKYSPLTAPLASLVYGQGGSFTANNCNGGGVGAASLCKPAGVAVDLNGNVYVADAGNNRILQYDPNSVDASMVFGQGGFFTTAKPNLGGTAPSAASLSLPLWLAVDSQGNLYAADAGNNRVIQYLAPLGPPNPPPSPGTATLSASGLFFGNVAKGNTSLVKPVTLTNNGTAAIIINAINRVGPNPTDFPQSNNCIGTLGGGKSCTINVRFSPSTPVGMPESAQFVIYDNATNAPQLFSTYGTSAAAATLTPASLSFGTVAVGSTSPAQNLTLANNRSSALTISSIALGGTNPGDFLKSTACGASLAAFSSCTVSIRMKPTATGPRSAKLSVTDNASSLPQSATLGGSGN